MTILNYFFALFSFAMAMACFVPVRTALPAGVERGRLTAGLGFIFATMSSIEPQPAAWSSALTILSSAVLLLGFWQIYRVYRVRREPVKRGGTSAVDNVGL